MSEENNLNQPISLSKAREIRRGNDSNEKLEISESLLRKVISECAEKSEQRQRTIIAEVVNEEVSSKIIRLENSVNKMILQFEGMKNGNSEDAALRVTTDSEASDLASISVDVPKEELYPYTCGMLAEKLKLRQHDVVQMIKKFDLRNDTKYHHSFKTGIRSEVHKWSEVAYQRLKQALDSGEYSRPVLD